MELMELPKLRINKGDTNYTLRIENELKENLEKLKTVHHIDVAEAVRLYLRNLVKSVKNETKHTG